MCNRYSNINSNLRDPVEFNDNLVDYATTIAAHKTIILSQTAFSTLNLPADLLKNLTSLGYQAMTEIQQQSLPPMLEGKDVIAQGKTGSGKTAAFGLALLAKLNVKRFRIQTLVLCPTRELAEQVGKEIRDLARTIHNIKVLTLCGGMPFGPQVGSLEHGAHIIVGTPGRVEDHLGRGTLKLNDVDTLVLDEADRMLDMGFQPTLDAIVKHIPTKPQTLLFSATFPRQIEQMANQLMTQPVMVKVTASHDSSSISEHFYRINSNDQRAQALRLLLLHHKPQSCVVFCNTKRETQNVADRLHDDGFSVLALHGDLEQADRSLTLIRFANKSASVLVATDVAARGLDIDAMDMVINYELAHDAETHVHRIGRTGRAGSKGMACSLLSSQDDYKTSLLEEYQDTIIKPIDLPPIELLQQSPQQALMVTLQIGAGKKQKIRPGDILGALTGENGLDGKLIGKITVQATSAFVAVDQKVAKAAFHKLADGKLKGRSVRVRLIN
jgi:ATP-independent RNA helicase DbpA